MVMVRRLGRLACGVATAAFVLATVQGCDRRSAERAPAMPGAVADADWTSFGGGSDETHFSALDQITPETVDRLGLAWSYDIDTFDAYTQPLAIGGVLYFAAGHSVMHALDARTGKLLWQYDPKVAEQPESKVRMRGGWGIRGIAFKDGRLFTGTRDGRLLAIDARSGKLLWSVQTLDEGPGGYITGPPFIAGDKVVIGFGGADYEPVRGYVTAYDMNSGSRAWRFHVVPGDPAKGFESPAMEQAAKTWTGEWWKLGGGGTVYHAMAYDARFDRIYLGTGNGFPWNQKIRSPGGGDNLYLGSIVALDRKTGNLVWHYQTNPGLTWDFNNAMDIQLTDVEIDGRRRQVLIHAPKNGFFYVIDRETGKLVAADKFSRANWAERVDLASGRPVENPAARYPEGKPFVLYPFPLGAHGVQAMAYSPPAGMAYIPVMDGGRVHIDPPDLKNWKYRPGMFVNTGLGAPPADIKVPPPTSRLVAWDVANKRQAWSIPQPGVANGGVLATAGGLLFQGRNDGKFVAMDAANGRELWSFEAQNGILSAPISYSVGGRQYVSVITSFRSSSAGKPNWDYRQQQRRVLTFAVGGTAKLPPFHLQDEPFPDDGAFAIDPAKVAVGAGVYGQSCVICHGIGGIAGGAAPDLRKSAVPLDAATFRQVVHDGGLMPRGMPGFENLTASELEGLRHFVRQRAREGAAGAAPRPQPIGVPGNN